MLTFNKSRNRLVWLILWGMATLPLRAADELDDAEDQAIKAAVAKVAPSVVRIETVGGQEIIGKSLAPTGPTTGVVIAADGYVVSSAFNFIGQPASILVTLPDGKRAAAEIVARDQSRMLVLLKVKSDASFPVPQAIPRSELQVGQWAIAVGRTFESSQPGISVGVVSALERVWGKAIQTDAKISPNNYGGALVDIRGRVIGILAPLSPHGPGSEVAGAEWYDSGIGFAVPLADIQARLEQWKKGKDLLPGVLGISLKAGDPYALPAELGACQFGSPAAKAGLKAGDVIVEADGRKVERQAQLKHALGPHYAGDVIRLVALRKDQRIEANVELTDKLVPYEHPFLGILPTRDVPGVVVRWVYPESPAAKAGLKPGDKITHALGQAVADVVAVHEKLAGLEPKQKVSLKITRGGEELNVELSPTSQPTKIPAELPPLATLPQAANRPAVGVVEVKLPEAKNACFAYVPENYHPEQAAGLVIWLTPPGELKSEAIAERWKSAASQQGLIVLVPRPVDAGKWEATEVEFIGKVADDIAKTYNIDKQRVAVLGEQSGGGIAWLFANNQPQRIRGLGLIDATLPPIQQLPENEPLQRWSLYISVGGKKPSAAGVRAVAKKLTELKFPVTLLDQEEALSPQNEKQTAEFARWVDTLDRI